MALGSQGPWGYLGKNKNSFRYSSASSPPSQLMQTLNHELITSNYLICEIVHFPYHSDKQANISQALAALYSHVGQFPRLSVLAQPQALPGLVGMRTQKTGQHLPCLQPDLQFFDLSDGTQWLMES
jgi:hypothetical protein